MGVTGVAGVGGATVPSTAGSIRIHGERSGCLEVAPKLDVVTFRRSTPEKFLELPMVIRSSLGCAKVTHPRGEKREQCSLGATGFKRAPHDKKWTHS